MIDERRLWLAVLQQAILDLMNADRCKIHVISAFIADLFLIAKEGSESGTSLSPQVR